MRWLRGHLPLAISRRPGGRRPPTLPRRPRPLGPGGGLVGTRGVCTVRTGAAVRPRAAGRIYPPPGSPCPREPILNGKQATPWGWGGEREGRRKAFPAFPTRAPLFSFCSGSRNCRPALAKGQAGIRRRGPRGPGGRRRPRRLLPELRAEVGLMQHSCSFASWAGARFRGAVGSLCCSRWVGSYTGWRRGQAGCWREGPGARPRFQSYSSPDGGLGVPDGSWRRGGAQEPGTVCNFRNSGFRTFLGCRIPWEFANSLLRKIPQSVRPEFLTSNPGTLSSVRGLPTPRS